MVSSAPAVRSAPVTESMFDRGRTSRLARRFEETERLRDALREYEKLVAIDKTDVSALLRIGDLERRLGLRGDAVDTGEKLAAELASKGRRLAALYRYKKLLEQGAALLGDPTGTERRLVAAIDAVKVEVKERRRTLATYDEAAQSLEKKGRDADLVELLVKMVALEPDNPVIGARLAEALCRLGRQDDALPAFRLAARSFVDFDRPGDALKVLERIFHFRVEPEDALFAARLYLERAERKDAVRAVAKLQACLTHDPESLDALALLARAFVAMAQPARSVQVKVEMARIAKEAGEIDLLRDLLEELVRVAPDDPVVRALAAHKRPLTSSAPALSVRSSFGSVTADLDELEDAVSEPEGSVLDELSFEEVSMLSEVWVMPVVSKEARRALDDAAAFMRLRLSLKAEDALLSAIEEDPVCGELREALRAVYKEREDIEGFVEETLVLADLYRQRRFFDRARKLLTEVFEVEPAHGGAEALRAELDAAELRESRAAPR